MQRNPKTIKSELVTLRRRLRTVEGHERNARRDLERVKRSGAVTSVIVDAQSEWATKDREARGIRQNIYDLETELLGEWAPKARASNA